MNVGKMRHRIKFQRFVNTVNENGFPITKWVDVKIVWGEVLKVSAREFYEAASVKEESNVPIRIRFIKGISSDMRFLLNGRTFELAAPPINEGELNKTLMIVGKEVI